MQLAAGVRERVAAVHVGGGLPECLRLYDGWAARYDQVPGGPGPFRSPPLPSRAPLTAVSPRRMWRRWSTGHRSWPPLRSPSPSPRRPPGRGCSTWPVAPAS